MVSMDVEKLITEVKLSSVVPGRITGEDKVHEFSNMDLAMKLHYIKGLYFFKREAVEGLDIHDIKKAMFPFLEVYYQACGRIRRSSGGRPFIKCNDSGVRIVEAKCNSKTVDEWMAMNDASSSSSSSSCVNEQLVYDQVLGPDLGFAPLVFTQFTWFKCGGMSIGLSWAHVLGDAFSASNFLNTWAQTLSGQLPPKCLDDNDKPLSSEQLVTEKLPFSLKRVDPPVGDLWKITNTCKMHSLSFHITEKQLFSKVNSFEVISAMLWKILAKVKQGESKMATFIGRDKSCDGGPAGNSQVMISTVEANVKISEADISELATLIAEKSVDETRAVEQLLLMDIVVYGANLTFVNLEDANIYGLKLRGKTPVFATYYMSGIGDEGVVLVLPAGPTNLNGRTVNVLLPQHQLAGFRHELKQELGLF